MVRAVLAIDQGTTSSRAAVVDERGETRAMVQQPITPLYPQPGWVNQDAKELWSVTLRVTQEALERAVVNGIEIAAVGITNQRETTILWDAQTGEPVAPAIVWQSRQSAEIVDDLVRRDMGATYQRLTGLVPDAYFSATKIAWLLEHDPALRARADAGELRFGTVDSWLVWNLSGGRMHVTDYSNAARTMLFDIRAGTWSDELLSDLRIPRSLLPEVMENSVAFVETDPAVLGAALPIAGMAGDQQAALFGQACFEPGEAKNTYGTGSFLLMNTGGEAVTSTCNLLTTIAWSMAGRRSYALEGAIFVTGSAVQWLRDGLGIISDSSEMAGLAGLVPDSGGVSFVPALVGLGAPYWDANARGTITGITRGTTAAHIARATLDAIACQTRDVIDAMAEDSNIALSELRVDGGASQNDLLMQIQADVLGVPVVRPKITETTVYGAAYLAGLATGVWGSLEEVKACWAEDRRFEPAMTEPDRAALYGQWQDAVARARTS